MTYQTQVSASGPSGPLVYVLKLNLGYQGWNSQNACREDPAHTVSSAPSPVLLYSFSGPRWPQTPA